MKKLIVGSIKLLVVAFFVVSLTAIPARAIPIWHSDASGELTGSRSSDVNGGVTATEQWANGGFDISWTITSLSGGKWQYDYEITAERKGLSHFILEVTEDDNPFNIFDGTSPPYEGPKTWDQGPSNPQMPNPIYGVKFDFGDTVVTYTMITDRAPVYGVFYTKDGRNQGNDVVAWSDALNNANYKTDMSLTTTDFIVRPDGAVIPEPSTLLLLGTSLLGIFGLSRCRKKR
jgi:hypothetical protein